MCILFEFPQMKKVTCFNLLLGDIQNAFQGQFFKVKAITLIEVCADRLWVVVYYNCLLAHLSQGSDAGHRTPVKLNTAAWWSNG